MSNKIPLETLTEGRKASLRGYLGIECPPYNAGAAVTGNITLDRANGPFQQVTLTGVTVARTLNAIANGSAGLKLLLRIVSDGTAAIDRTLSLDTSIILPDEYAGPNPITLPQGKVRTLLLYCTGTSWEVQSVSGAYTA